MTKYGGMRTNQTVDQTRGDIRDCFRKWATVQGFEILPRPTNGFTASVEFWVNGEKRTLACDRFSYDSYTPSSKAYATNLRAVFLTLDALRLADERGILRELAAAAAGFLEAPGAAKPKRPWHEVLGVMPMADVEVVKAAFKASAKSAHPDGGGTDERMSELNAAYEEAKKERGFE
jgi:hypothetical protein